MEEEMDGFLLGQTEFFSECPPNMSSKPRSLSALRLSRVAVTMSVYELYVQVLFSETLIPGGGTKGEGKDGTH